MVWWEAQEGCRCCPKLSAERRGTNIFHAGYIAAGRRPGGAKAGELCEAAMQSGQGNYLAKLILYPGNQKSAVCLGIPVLTNPPLFLSRGRFEFLDYLPEGTQGVVVQPVGKTGVLVAGTDTVRGFSSLDQVRKSLLLGASRSYLTTTACLHSTFRPGYHPSLTRWRSA